MVWFKSHDINYKQLSTWIRKKTLKMVFSANASHIGSALSIVDILTVLYFKILSINPKNPWSEDRDRFILSKGHGCSSLYATLALKGFFSKEILNTFSLNGGILPAMITLNCVPGAEVSTGSLGHGFSMGIGMAIAAKHDKRNYRTFILLGDGECNEGSTWEAAMFASHHKLNNLIVIIDYNKLQAFGRIEEIIDLEPFKDKWNAFGWAVKEIDGHNFSEIEKTLSQVPFIKNKPSIVIAHTIKGKGVSYMENKLEWHYKSPNKEQLEVAYKELDSI